MFGSKAGVRKISPEAEQSRYESSSKENEADTRAGDQDPVGSIWLMRLVQRSQVS